MLGYLSASDGDGGASNASPRIPRTPPSVRAIIIAKVEHFYTRQEWNGSEAMQDTEGLEGGLVRVAYLFSPASRARP